jgi:hypothetical protein
MYNKAEGSNSQASQYTFDRNLLFNDAFVDWKPFKHPQYGDIEIGGFKKSFGRLHPGFLLESDAHRNMSFTLYHAYHTPKISVDEIAEKDLGGGLKEITAVIANKRMIPTHSSQDLKYKIEVPDMVSIEGTKVIAGMIVENRDLNITKEQKNNPSTIQVANIPGNATVTVRWIVQNAGKYTVKVESKKGGIATKSKN